MNKKLLSLYSLKFNPFAADVPVSALWPSPPIESFCWRIEQQVGEGGFALVVGEPGSGKSVALRLLAQRLSQLPDVTVGILTLILAGDGRLAARLETPDLLPVASRIRARLRTEMLSPQQLLQCLSHLLKTAGNPQLLPPSLLQTLCEHAAGNLRLLMNLGNDLLAAALHQQREAIDDQLFFEVFALDPKPKRS
jgi:type II secretory pathway predicted ATPase ExeA